MRAMILAAGLGTRMRPLTNETPKALIKVGKKYLIEFAIENLKSAGITEICINLFYFAQKIKQTLGNGSALGVNIEYIEESQRLETGGGIINALSRLGNDPFIVISSDVICDFDLAQLHLRNRNDLAHLVMVPNPDYHPEGDFGIEAGHAKLDSLQKLTFANIALYNPILFNDIEVGHFPLRKILWPAIEQGKVTAELHHGKWFNIGTPKDLASALQTLTA